MTNKYGNFIMVVIIGLLLIGYYLYYTPKFVNGEQAKDFEFTTLDGKTQNLSDLQGQFVLLDFWGSWCGPCRQESPELVKLYHDFKDKQFKNAAGFTILSIALENNEKRWKAAIQRDQLSWLTHYTDLKRMKSPIAKAYGVREIPTKYLINPEGYIAGVNMKFEDLRSFLTERQK